MHQEPVPQHPGRDENPSGVPAGPGDHPWLGSPHWRLVPQSPAWDEAYLTEGTPAAFGVAWDWGRREKRIAPSLILPYRRVITSWA